MIHQNILFNYLNFQEIVFIIYYLDTVKFIGECRDTLIKINETIGNHPKTSFMKPVFEILDNLNKKDKRRVGVLNITVITDSYKKLESI